MARRRLPCGGAPLVLAALLVAAAPARADDRLVAGLRAPLGPAAEQVLARGSGVHIVRRIAALRALQLSVRTDRLPRALAALRADPRVAFAESDPVIRVRPTRLPAPFLAGIARTPDDRGFTYQLGLMQGNDHDIDATDAWSHRTTCAKVAVLDTGVALDHPDLRPNLWRNPGEIPGNGLDDDHDGYFDDVYGVDLVRGRGSGADHNGHGTHVAGIIAARGNNRRGVAGVCWRAQIISVRFLGRNGSGRLSDGDAGIVYAVAHGARVINASFGSSQTDELQARAVGYAREHGALIVAAAGNDGVDSTRQPNYPSDLPSDNIISVGASDRHDRRAGFSNYGQNVDLFAPGAGIASTWPGGRYRDLSGTSNAAPFVSGAAAMLREAAHPSLAVLRAELLESVDHPPALRGTSQTGGRLNLARALRIASRR